MLTFFAVVNSGVAIVCAIFYYFLYAVTFNTDLLFDVHIHGKIILASYGKSSFRPFLQHLCKCKLFWEWPVS